MPDTRLILLRHGETDYNMQNRYYGFSDPPLNDKGRWQSKRLAERLKDKRIDRIYSSDLKRAYQTGKLIFRGRYIRKSPDFREINFGIFEKLTYYEIMNKYPKLYKDWIENPADIRVPGGETLKDLNIRVLRMLSFILMKHSGRTVAVITHGGPIKVLLCNALRTGFKKFWEMKQECAALNIIDYADEALPVVVCSNDISHIEETERKD